MTCSLLLGKLKSFFLEYINNADIDRNVFCMGLSRECAKHNWSTT